MKGTFKQIILAGTVFALIAASAALTVGTPKEDAVPASARGGPPPASEVETMQKKTENGDWRLLLVGPGRPVPEGYVPALGKVQGDYEMDRRAAPYLIEMIEAAKEDGIGLTVVSAYRTEEYQRGLFEQDVELGRSRGLTEEEAVRETAASIAVPGTSEHQTGLAADLLCEGWDGGLTEGFAETEAYAWLRENSARFGFIERYPKGATGITGIIFEPWHYRFVGKAHALEIAGRGVTLEEYLDA